MIRAAAFVAVLALAGAVAATSFLQHRAEAAFDRLLDERLRGAGEAAAVLLDEPRPASRRLRAVMRANALDGVYLLDRDLTVHEDALGQAGGRADLLRVDPERVQKAFAGEGSIATSYQVGDVPIRTGYFPVKRDGRVRWVVALEAGEPFSSGALPLRRARDLALVLALIVAVALGLGAAKLGAAQERAARGEVMRRMAAMAAHEIRNPLGTIRGIVELVRERPTVVERDRDSLGDVLVEVERLRRLTDDFLDLGTDRPLASAPVDLQALLAEATTALSRQFPEVRVQKRLEGLPSVRGDAGRLRQVFTNLLVNAAQADPSGEIELHGSAEGEKVRVRVRDRGPGIDPALRDKLFDPFVTSKRYGTGLGLAISRRLVERHGGTLGLIDEGAGATFEVALPRV